MYINSPKLNIFLKLASVCCRNQKSKIQSKICIFGPLTPGNLFLSINLICLFLTGVQYGSTSVFENEDRKTNYHANMALLYEQG